MLGLVIRTLSTTKGACSFCMSYLWLFHTLKKEIKEENTLRYGNRSNLSEMERKKIVQTAQRD